MDDLRDEILELFDNLIDSLEEYGDNEGITHQIEEARDDFESSPIKLDTKDDDV